MRHRALWRIQHRWIVTLLSAAVMLSLTAMASTSVRAAPISASPRSANVRQLCSRVSEKIIATTSPAAQDEATVRRAIDAFQRCLTAHDTAPSGQDSHWLALKNAHRIGRNGVVLPANQVSPLVTWSSLPTGVVSNTVEALGNLWCNGVRCNTYDDGGNGYIDRYYWNFCGAGAVENALQYWGQTIDNHGSGWYTEPSYVSRRTSTYWLTGGYNRAYEMYIAEYSMPPSFGTPGLVAFGTYPNAGAVLSDVTDVLNWEASGKQSTWKNYFYARVSNSGLSATTLHNDIVTDIRDVRLPVVVEVNTGGNLFSPFWSNTSVIHYLTIVGYDDVAGTYTYTDTCGTACGSGQDGGVRTVSQANLYQAIINVGSGGGYSW